jgi:hypothetical protein
LPFRYYPPDSLPVAFDIVWCRYPYDESPDEPGPIQHPTIVRQPLFDEDGNPHVRVIYGTSQEPLIRGAEFFTVATDLRRSGLSKPTRFCIDREARVPWAEEYFDPSISGRPRLARLAPEAIREFQIQVAYFQQQNR